jgi:hypothetical protein
MNSKGFEGSGHGLIEVLSRHWPYFNDVKLILLHVSSRKFQYVTQDMRYTKASSIPPFSCYASPSGMLPYIPF